MKRTLFLFICTLISLSVFSKTTDSKDIHLQARNANKEALRSIVPVRAQLDGCSVVIEFFNSPEDVTIEISDADNQEIETGIYASPELIRLPIPKTSGNYCLDIICNDTHFYGEFFVE